MEGGTMHEIQRMIFVAILGAAFLSGCGTVQNTTPCPLTPAETTIGWDVRKLDEAFRFACKLGTTTLIVAANGEVVRSMGDVAAPHRVHSVRKALLSALVGQHIGTGPKQINLESTLAELGIDDEPHTLTELQKEAKVLNLIKSVSGINHTAAAEGGLMQKDKDRRLGQAPNIPGTKWAYNNWDYNALTTIFMQETGLSVFEAFKEGIADPLDMQDFGKDAVYLEYERELSMHPKAGFKMSARDLAKFGQLYLNKGKWNGKQIIPEEWIDRITDDYTITGKKLLRSGHGYLWWVPVDNKSREMGIPEGTYVATGFGSQRIVVIPHWDTVIVHQVNVIDCIVSVMKKQQTTFKGAIIHLYMCKFPLFSLREDCQKCGFAVNFLDSGFVKILSRIIDARIPKNQK
jgi:hypothetical protein